MVRATSLLCLLVLSSAGAARQKVKLGPAVVPDEPGLPRPQKPGRAFSEPSEPSEPSAMLNTTTGRCGARSIPWTSGQELGDGKGANGKIMEVFTTDGHYPWNYAIKMPKHYPWRSASRKEIDDEAFIMAQTTALGEQAFHHAQCQHVAPVIDPSPCYNGEEISSGAYVSLKMAMDLQQWYDRSSDYRRSQCKQVVATQLIDGLTCLHTAGYMHGDFKMDNVLLESVDEYNGCPVGLRVIDFGLSGARGVKMDKYEYRYYFGSHHLPDSLFQSDGRYVVPDSLGLASERAKFRASSNVDWCSFVNMMNSHFAYNPSIPRHDAANPTDCGKMGDNRQRDVEISWHEVME